MIRRSIFTYWNYSCFCVFCINVGDSFANRDKTFGLIFYTPAYPELSTSLLRFNVLESALQRTVDDLRIEDDKYWRMFWCHAV